MSISRSVSCVLVIAALACKRDATPHQARTPDRPTDTTHLAPGAADLVLRLNATSYSASDTVRLQLFNRSSAEVGYNLCTSRLEHHAGDAWTVMPDHRACTMELRLLAPGDSAAGERTFDPAVTAGEYRLVSVIDAGGQVREVASQPFTVSARVSP